MKTHKDELLNKSIQMLDDIYKIAKKKEDTETMTSVSDRVCMLYEKMLDVELDRKTPPGFLSIGREDDE